MKKVGLIGEGILSSFSPAIHNFLFAQHNIQGQYNLFNISTNALEDTVKSIVSKGYAGFNVTSPYKKKIINFLDEIDEIAQKIGSINTVAIRQNKLIGYNTDWYGFLKGIEYCNLTFHQITAMVLGAGGAAAAILYALNKKKVPLIYLCNRTQSHAIILSKNFHNVIIAPWKKRNDIIRECNLIINSTTVTTNLISFDHIPANAVINDIIYLPTELQKHQNCISGMGMLIWQADLAFKIWFDKL